MSETTLKLLELIKEGKKLNEICTELNKTPKQIFNHLTLLKNKGYLKTDKLKNPANDSKECEGYLEIKKTDTGPEFKAHVKCEKLYTTDNHYNAPPDSDYFRNLSD